MTYNSQKELLSEALPEPVSKKSNMSVKSFGSVSQMSVGNNNHHNGEMVFFESEYFSSTMPMTLPST